MHGRPHLLPCLRQSLLWVARSAGSQGSGVPSSLHRPSQSSSISVLCTTWLYAGSWNLNSDPWLAQQALQWVNYLPSLGQTPRISQTAALKRAV